tara:strand:- start:4811 stop:5479 length:669 start_codon:yes stop_codon:yes gene_type:complete
MTEQTLETKLNASVNKYIEAGNKIDKFINGTEIETIDTVQGSKPTIAKIIKDNTESIEASKLELYSKVQQASTSASTAEQLKNDTQTMLTNFQNTHLPNINQSLEKNKQDILANANNISGKADKLLAEPIAAGYILYVNGELLYSHNIKMVSRVATGTFQIYLDDSLKGKTWDVMATSVTNSFAVLNHMDYANGTFKLDCRNASNLLINHQLGFRVYERKGA